MMAAMWNVRTRSLGGLGYEYESGEVVSVRLIERLLWRVRERGFPVPDTAFRALGDDRWVDEAVPGLTAIETYANAAVQDFRDSGSLDRRGPALVWRPELHRPVTAWHDRTLLVMPIQGSRRGAILEYAEPFDERGRLVGLEPRTRRLTPTYVDWRMYLGVNTEVVEGETQLWPIGRGRWRTWINLPRRASGVLLAKVVRRMGGLRTTYEFDPSQRSRLERAEANFPLLSMRFARLGANSERGEIMAVFVHGTRSSGLASLKDLAGHLTVPTVRFEHDTFRPVDENAQALATMVRESVSARKVLLLAHSRGGLVARLAASYLRDTADAPDIETWTFGTPHRGTPVVGRALEVAAGLSLGRRRKLGTISKLDVDTWPDGGPAEDPVSAALSILMRSASLPPGIAVMAPGSGELSMINSNVRAFVDKAIGGACSPDDPSGGYGVFSQHFASELFSGAPNDFVVGQDSSTGSGGGFELPNPCGHSGYFRDPDVRDMMP
jgi:hypothetical protein